MRRFRGRISTAHLLAGAAVFIALGGVAGALPGRNSVDSGDLKPNAVHSSDIKNDDVKGVDVAEATLGTVPEATVGGPVAYALIRGTDGVPLPGHTRGIAAANVTARPISSYCFAGLPAFSFAVATPAYLSGADDADVTAKIAYPDTAPIAASDCPGAQMEVTTSADSGFAKRSFFVALYR